MFYDTLGPQMKALPPKSRKSDLTVKQGRLVLSEGFIYIEMEREECMQLVEKRGGLSLGQSFGKVVFHWGVISSGWSFVGVVSHQGGPSTEQSFGWVVFHWVGISSAWSFIRVGFH